MSAGDKTGNMASLEAFIAANRFGFGAKPGELGKIASDPKAWALAQLDVRFIRNERLDALGQSVEPPKDLIDFLKKQATTPLEENLKKIKDLQQDSLHAMIRRYTEDVGTRMRATAESDAPLFERLVQFWSNHFTVSAVKWGDMPVVVSFERDAIRPHVLGDFETLLVSSTRHPAMLIYLDNIESLGPRSPAGVKSGRGLNENLAREIMELHTLGVDGGYTQSDVTEFAKVLTGWNVTGESTDGAWSWKYRYDAKSHEPGVKKLLGMEYAENGEKETREVLHDLAFHPSTAKFIAKKLARHFISDDPPQSAIDRLAAVFTENKGQLLPVYKELIALDEVWRLPLPKLKTPNEFILSVLRATNMDAEDTRLLAAARDLGQMPFTAVSPAGWSDEAKDWMSTESLLQRLGVAQLVARTIYTRVNPLELLESTIGPVVTEKTRAVVTAAGSAFEAITLLLASPEFQRR